MKYATAMLAASAVAANAQFTLNPNGTITCAASNPNAAYCASSSLGSPIIIRCKDGVGEAGNCSDNLAGEPPSDVTFGECYQTSTTVGDAACSKNCIVYPAGGAPFALPASLCTPSDPSAYSSALTSSKTTSTATSVPTGSITITSTGTATYTSAGTTVTKTFTTTYCPESTLSTVVLPSGTGVISYPGTNGTKTGGSGSGYGSGYAKPTGSSPTGTGNGGSSNGTVTSGNGGSGSNPTATPVGPSTTGAVPFTGGAISNSASAALAVVGLTFALFL